MSGPVEECIKTVIGGLLDQHQESQTLKEKQLLLFSRQFLQNVQTYLGRGDSIRRLFEVFFC